MGLFFFSISFFPVSSLFFIYFPVTFSLAEFDQVFQPNGHDDDNNKRKDLCQDIERKHEKLLANISQKKWAK